MAELAALNVKITGDASGIKAAANSASRSVETFTKSAEASAKVFERAFQQNERSVDRLRRSIDPLYAASKKYETAVATLDKALKNGNLTQAQHSRLLDQAGAAYLTAGGQAQKAAASFSRMSLIGGSMGNKLQQVGFQLQDVAIQLQAGTRASVVFAQQGSQIASVFGPVGAMIGTLAAVGIPLLAVAFANGTEKAATFDDALEAMRQTATDMEAVLETLKLTTDELIEKYGFAAQRVREFALAQAELLAAQAATRMAEQIDVLNEAMREYTQTSATAFRSGTSFSDGIRNLQRDFGLTADAAYDLTRALFEIKRSTTFEEQQAALSRVLALLEEHNVALAEIPPELQRAISEMITFSNETDRARAIMSQLSAEAAGVTVGVPLYQQGQDSLLPPAASSGGGGGRARRSGGGGGGGANPVIAQLESLKQSLLSQEEAQIASFEKQQETLQKALEQRLLTQQEYNALMEEAQQQHSDKMAQIDAYRYGDGLQKAGAFFGDMADALANGNEEMMRISKAFGAAEALINAWRAYSQTLADPSLPFFAKFAAAAKVLASGMAAVNAIKGSGKSGGGSGASTAAANANSAPQPLQVSLTGLDPSSYYLGSDVGALLDRLGEEAGDRGYRLMVAR